MGQIKVKKNVGGIEGLCIIEPTLHGDSRGYFMETYNKNDMAEAGLTMEFVQDNQSASTKGVLRGLHFQKQHPQGKLVRVINGTVFDVVVDLRSHSGTYVAFFARLTAICVISSSQIKSSFHSATTSATVSSETAFKTTRTFGFFSRSARRISRSLPPLPPMNACVGTGSSPRHSGASPFTTTRFFTPARDAFSAISPQASSPCSTAYTRSCFDRSAASTAIEPVPLPIS